MPDVRAAALVTCAKLKAGGLWERVIPLLNDEQASVRASAATYIARLPHVSALQSLQTAVESESDRSVLKPMKKALRACEKVWVDPMSGH